MPIYLTLRIFYVYAVHFYHSRYQSPLQLALGLSCSLSTSWPHSLSLSFFFKHNTVIAALIWIGVDNGHMPKGKMILLPQQPLTANSSSARDGDFLASPLPELENWQAWSYAGNHSFWECISPITKSYAEDSILQNSYDCYIFFLFFEPLAEVEWGVAWKCNVPFRASHSQACCLST